MGETCETLRNNKSLNNKQFANNFEQGLKFISRELSELILSEQLVVR